jgi:hypothetical protein
MKTYNVQNDIGEAKYVVNFHDGIKKHKDGSSFYDIALFSNKKKLQTFVDNLGNNSYINQK